jgi:hypothetical protein
MKKKIRKISDKLSYEGLYYLCGGYDYDLEDGIFKNCEEGRFDGVRGEVIKKLAYAKSNYVSLTLDELKCYTDWIGEAVSIKADHIVDTPSEYGWTRAKQNRLEKYFQSLCKI